MQITDRSKDVIKSGEAAVIGVPHPKWDERPLVIAVRCQGSKLTSHDLLAFYEGKIAKWWMPDDVLFVDELPHGATGKLLKIKLRELYGDHKLPTLAAAKTA